jgi:hypothetical protein
MGVVENSIKANLLRNVYDDFVKVYEFIDARFDLSEAQKDEVIKKINFFNDDLSAFLKDVKLS